MPKFILKHFQTPFYLLAKKMEFDLSVFYNLSTRMWTILAGSFSIFLVVSHFSKIEQGYYYTFSSILGLQVFVEMGIGSVIQQFASHEWAKLKLDDKGKIIGDPNSLSKLISIANISVKWFFLGSIILVVGLTIGGYIFFHSNNNISQQWKFPWLFLCLSTGMNFILTPMWALLEGCNQVKKLYGFRFLQGIIINLAVWASIILGFGLWATVVSSIVSIICGVIFIRKRYYLFFLSIFFKKNDGPRISWQTDMLTMQWKVAISWISGYLSFFLFTPILFKFQGPVIAGQFGMTWAIVSVIGGFGIAWLPPKVPQFAILVSQRNYKALDELFFKIVKIISLLTLTLAFLFWLLVFFLNIFKSGVAIKFSSRLIPPTSLAFLLIGQTFQMISVPFSTYMRAHKKEPVMFLSIFQGILIASSTYFFGRYYGVMGICLSYMLINILSLPLVINLWYKFRKIEILLNNVEN
jgi:O-antigen/teichoic acid export membrane protein